MHRTAVLGNFRAVHFHNRFFGITFYYIKYFFVAENIILWKKHCISGFQKIYIYAACR